MADVTQTSRRIDGWTIGFWVLQAVLAVFYLYSGNTKLTHTADMLAGLGWLWALDVPRTMINFIGTAEVLGALGLLLPAGTRTMPYLTPLAAAGLALLQVLAIGLHVSRGEFSVLPFNVVVLALTLLLVWGRTRKSVITER